MIIYEMVLSDIRAISISINFTALSQIILLLFYNNTSDYYIILNHCINMESRPLSWSESMKITGINLKHKALAYVD